MEAQSISAARAVHFSQACVLILDHELTVPSQSPSGTAGAIFRAFNPIAKGFALHLPTTLGGRAAHARRSSSTESSLQLADDSPGATSPRLGRRVSGARKNSLTAYPSVQLPLRSCLKTPNRDIPPTPISPTPPGAFHHSPPPSPVHVRGRSMSRSSLPPNSVSTSPPPAPAHHLSIPTEIIPLQPCCDTCNEATDLVYSMGNSYRISWSAAAAAKKKRDDAEERGDILAGLKRACNYKWNRVLDGDDYEDDDDDGFCGPITDGSDECPGAHATSCPPGSAAALDPLSKLDGLSRSPAASTSSLNKDWTPQKYYDSEDEDQDLFPLPSPSMSPQPSPLTGSPASSATHLPSANRPISPLVPTNDKFPPVARSHLHGQVSLGLPPIAGSAPPSPAAGSARSSVVSLSDAGSGRSRGSVQSHHSRGPSPIRVAASTNAARQHLDAPSVATASTGSSSRTGSSGRMWTTSFVPPPLPTRTELQTRKLVGAEGTSKSPLLSTGGTAKSTNLNTTAAAKLKGERDRGERAHPPPMPTYSGAQREVMIVATSKGRERERERERVSASQQPKRKSKEYGEKALPPPPPIKDANYENTSDSTPVGSRSGSMARRNGGSPYEDYFEDTTVDLSLSRVPTATVLNTPKSARSYYAAQEDDQLGPLTSPVTSPAKRRGGSISQQQQQQQPTPPRTLMRAGSGQNLKINTSGKSLALEEAVAAAASSREGRQHRRSSTATDVVDENGVLAAASRGGGDSSRNRASSIRRLWKGIGSVASGIGAVAGAI